MTLRNHKSDHEMEKGGHGRTLEALFGEDCFRAVADCTSDWESWHAPDGHLVWVNSAVERITGYTVQDCLKMDDYPLSLILQEDREPMAQLLAEARAGSSRHDVEFQLVHRNGETRYMAMSWQPMANEAGVQLGFRTSVRDVTERHKLRLQLRLYTNHLEQLVQERTAKIQRLEQYQRQMEKMAALGQLAAGVAHEVNNPLAGIRNAFELIKADLALEDEHHELLELIDREIERIGSITHQMYQLYRRDPAKPHQFEIGRIVGEVVTLLESVARKHEVSLYIKPASQPITADLPEGEVKQILYNLIRNAIQASLPKHSVEIGIEQVGDLVQIAVIDHGVGIAKEVLPHIFDPFFSTKTEEAKIGMGLGLSVSRSLIESMGGSIVVESRLGEGSRFSALFPERMVLPPASPDE